MPQLPVDFWITRCHMFIIILSRMVHDNIMSFKVFSLNDNPVWVHQDWHVQNRHVGTKDQKVISYSPSNWKQRFMKAFATFIGDYFFRKQNFENRKLWKTI